MANFKVRKTTEVGRNNEKEIEVFFDPAMELFYVNCMGAVVPIGGGGGGGSFPINGNGADITNPAVGEVLIEAVGGNIGIQSDTSVTITTPTYTSQTVGPMVNTIGTTLTTNAGGDVEINSTGGALAITGASTALLEGFATATVRGAFAASLVSAAGVVSLLGDSINQVSSTTVDVTAATDLNLIATTGDALLQAEVDNVIAANTGNAVLQADLGLVGVFAPAGGVAILGLDEVRLTATSVTSGNIILDAQKAVTIDSTLDNVIVNAPLGGFGVTVENDANISANTGNVILNAGGELQTDSAGVDIASTEAASIESRLDLGLKSTTGNATLQADAGLVGIIALADRAIVQGELEVRVRSVNDNILVQATAGEIEAVASLKVDLESQTDGVFISAATNFEAEADVDISILAANQVNLTATAGSLSLAGATSTITVGGALQTFQVGIAGVVALTSDTINEAYTEQYNSFSTANTGGAWLTVVADAALANKVISVLVCHSGVVVLKMLELETLVLY